MANKNDNLKEIWCVILDAEYKENLGTATSPTFRNGIFLRLQELKTNEIFTSHLTSQEVQAITGLSAAMSSKQLIEFARNLRERENPIRMLVPKNSRIVKSVDIKAGESLDHTEDETAPKKTSVNDAASSRFSIKKPRTKKQNKIEEN